MTDQRTNEDRLREEYFLLLPDIRRVTEQLEAEVSYSVLPILHKLQKHDRLEVTSRIKDCESAVGSLRRRQEGRTFLPDRPYTLTDLKDLAGVRVLAFPRSRVTEVDQQLRKRFRSWKEDPVPGFGKDEQPLAFKYYGYCEEASTKVRGEYQVVSMLIGLFWEVEHSAFYKLDPKLKGAAGFWKMQQRTSEVYTALRVCEDEFGTLISRPSSGGTD